MAKERMKLTHTTTVFALIRTRTRHSTLTRGRFESEEWRATAKKYHIRAHNGILIHIIYKIFMKTFSGALVNYFGCCVFLLVFVAKSRTHGICIHSAWSCTVCARRARASFYFLENNSSTACIWCPRVYETTVRLVADDWAFSARRSQFKQHWCSISTLLLHTIIY